MEGQPSRAAHQASDRRGSTRASLHGDVRDLWSTAMLSEPRENMSLSVVCENFDDEGTEVGKARGRYRRSVHLKEKVSFSPEELEKNVLMELDEPSGRPADSNLEVVPEDSQREMEPSSSLLSVDMSKHTPHRAYWEEQQKRLPLPLMELMENEALEILTKALKSYRSLIGKEHFLTKELQRYIEGLKKRRSKRLYCMSQ